MRQGRWSDAAYCAGVLSHYFTDPVMPLHTAQSKKESVVHRPLEWSVTKSYDKILERFRQGGYRVEFDLGNGDGWLAGAVHRGAELSNRHYDELIDRYDLAKGSRRPVEGFDDASIEILAGLFGVALTGWARIIERAADESNVEIPAATLSLTSLVASISMPVAWIVRRIASASEQKAVQAIFDEFQSTGQVTENLPPEVRSVRQERKRDRAIEQQRSSKHPKETSRFAATEPTGDQGAKVGPVEQKPAAPMTIPLTETRPSAAPSLAMTDDLVDAPSIGPKTAKRFAAIGITTVQQFVSASAPSMASRLNTRWIKTETIQDWQDQARLVASVPGLCGYKAQLLVGVECRDRAALAAQSASRLHVQIAQFAATKAGKRALRSSRVPTEEDVRGWISSASEEELKQAG